MNGFQTLNERFFSGSPEAFDLLFDRLAPKLLGFARSYVALHEAEDIVQDAFISLWQKREELPLNTDLSKLLFTITKNKCIDLLRHRQQIAKFNDYQTYRNLSALTHSKLDALDYDALEKILMVAVNALPDKCKEAFMLSRYYGKTYQQIAAELNVSVKTVEKRMSTALALLKKSLGSTLFSWLLIGIAN